MSVVRKDESFFVDLVFIDVAKYRHRIDEELCAAADILTKLKRTLGAGAFKEKE